jgi:hypothetical protein
MNVWPESRRPPQSSLSCCGRVARDDLLGVESLPHLLAVGRGRNPTPTLVGVPLGEFPTLLADGRIGDSEATNKEQLLDIPVAEAEPVIPPHAMANDLGRETVVPVAVDGYRADAASIAHLAGLNKLTKPHAAQSLIDRGVAKRSDEALQTGPENPRPGRRPALPQRVEAGAEGIKGVHRVRAASLGI